MLPYIADMDPMGNDIIKPPKGDENGAVLEPFDQIRHGIQKMAGLYGKTIFMVQFFRRVYPLSAAGLVRYTHRDPQAAAKLQRSKSTLISGWSHSS